MNVNRDQELLDSIEVFRKRVITLFRPAEYWLGIFLYHLCSSEPKITFVGPKVFYQKWICRILDEVDSMSKGNNLIQPCSRTEVTLLQPYLCWSIWRPAWICSIFSIIQFYWKTTFMTTKKLLWKWEMLLRKDFHLHQMILLYVWACFAATAARPICRVKCGEYKLLHLQTKRLHTNSLLHSSFNSPIQWVLILCLLHKDYEISRRNVELLVWRTPSNVVT